MITSTFTPWDSAALSTQLNFIMQFSSFKIPFIEKKNNTWKNFIPTVFIKKKSDSFDDSNKGIW